MWPEEEVAVLTDTQYMLRCSRKPFLVFCGQQQDAVKVVAVPGTESKWNVVGSRLAQVLIGASSDGKNNVKNIVFDWLRCNAEVAPTATAVWQQGHITVHGLLKKLPTTRHQIQLINGELEKVVNVRLSQYLQEEDFIEILDGSKTLGKGTTQAETCVAAHAVCWLGTYVKQMGGSSNGRTNSTCIYICKYIYIY